MGKWSGYVRKNLIKAKMMEHELRYEDLTREIGYSSTVLSDFINGITCPQLPIAVKLMKFFNVNFEYFFNMDGQETDESEEENDQCGEETFDEND